MRVRPTVRLACSILAFQLCVGPQALLLAADAAPAPQVRIPADRLFGDDTLAFVSCPDAAAAREAFRASALGRILAEPAVRESLGRQREAFLAFLQVLAQPKQGMGAMAVPLGLGGGEAAAFQTALGRVQDLLGKTGLTPREAVGILDGPLAVGWTGAGVRDGKLELKAAAVAWVKDGERVRDILRTLWHDGLRTSVPESAKDFRKRQAGKTEVYWFVEHSVDVTLELAISGNWVIVTTGPAAMDALLASIAKGGATHPLASSVRYQDCMTRLKGDGVPTCVVYADLERALATAETALPAVPEMPPEALPKIRKVIDILGLREARAFASVSRLDGLETSSRSVLVTEGPRKGLLALLDGGNQPFVLSEISKDAQKLSACRFDAAKAWDLARQVLAAVEPKAVEQAREALRQAEQSCGGVELRELVDSLGSEMLLVQGGPSPVPNVPELSLRVKLKDAARAGKAVEALLEFANAMLQAKGQGTLQPQTLDGATHAWMFQGQGLPVAPCIALTADWLVIDLTLPGLKRTLEGMGGGKGNPVTGTEAFKSATRKVPAQGGSFSFDDVKGHFAADYSQGIQGLQLMSMGLVATGMPMPLDLASLPPVEAILPHLGPSVSRSWSDAGGLWTESRSHLSLGDGGGVVAVAVVGVLAGLMLPVLHKARAAAEQTTAIMNLKMIGLGCRLYEDREGTFPPDLESLLDSGDIQDAKILQSDRKDPSSGFRYIVPPKAEPEDPSRWIVAFDEQPRHAGKRAVLFLDCSARAMVEAEFQALLAAQGGGAQENPGKGKAVPVPVRPGQPGKPGQEEQVRPEQVAAVIQCVAGASIFLAALGASGPSLGSGGGLVVLAGVGVVAAFAIPNMLMRREFEKATEELEGADPELPPDVQKSIDDF